MLEESKGGGGVGKKEWKDFDCTVNLSDKSSKSDDSVTRDAFLSKETSSHSKVISTVHEKR